MSTCPQRHAFAEGILEGINESFPKGPTPNPPDGAKAGAALSQGSRSTALAPTSNLTGAATAPAALVPGGAGVPPVSLRPGVSPADFLQQLGALRHQVKELEQGVSLVLLNIQHNRAPRTARETELLGDEIGSLWRATKDLDQRMFDFVVMNRWNS